MKLSNIIIPAAGSVSNLTSVRPAILAASSVSLFWTCEKYAGTVITACVMDIGAMLLLPFRSVSAVSRRFSRTSAEISVGLFHVF